MDNKKNIEFENAVKTMMLHVDEDPEREGLKATPARVRKAYEFIYGGYKEDPKAILEKALFT
ncbi:MAG: GTP cyclohydrolase I, partial [Sulfurimonas sp.]|nr:GTP cyclohydrolase I [Sulfurimonas sp.]